MEIYIWTSLFLLQIIDERMTFKKNLIYVNFQKYLLMILMKHGCDKTEKSQNNECVFILCQFILQDQKERVISFPIVMIQ